jgi:hypothetical protein
MRTFGQLYLLLTIKRKVKNPMPLRQVCGDLEMIPYAHPFSFRFKLPRIERGIGKV